MIQIGFSTTDTLIGRAIRWFTRSVVSHVFLRFSVANADWVVEAGWRGVTILSWARFQEENRVVKLVPVPEAHSDDLLGAALDMVGVPYDYGGLLGMTWVLIGRWLKQKWRNPTQSSKALFCSEMTVLLLRRAGYPGAEHLDPRSTTPDDLLRFLEAA